VKSKLLIYKIHDKLFHINWAPVTTAWHVLFWMGQKASKYGGGLRIYWIRSRG